MSSTYKAGTYYANNREDRLAYYANNKDYINAYNKLYYEKNKEDILTKSRVRNKKWYEENKEEKLAKDRVVITCECGCEIAKGGLSKHKKSKKHEKLMEAKNKKEDEKLMEAKNKKEDDKCYGCGKPDWRCRCGGCYSDSE